MGPRAERFAPIAAAAALAGLLALLFFDATYLTSDAAMALAWGGEIVRGGSPDVTAPLLPVFHPLPTAVGGALTPIGADAMVDGYRALAIASLAALAYAAYRLGAGLGGTAAGLVAAGLLLTRPELFEFGLIAAIDIPFVALVLLALALLLERPLESRWWTLGLLALAGLLRPEAWVLSLAIGAWLAYRSRGATRAGVIALALAAPVIWALADLALTGVLLGTVGEARGGFGEQLSEAGFDTGSGGGGRGLGFYLDPLDAVVDLLGWPLALGGLAAAVWSFFQLRRGERVALLRSLSAGPPAPEPVLGRDARAALLACFALLSICVVLGLRLLDFPFSIRFVALPASVLAVLFAGALARFAPPPPWRAALLAAAIAIAITLPADLDTISDKREMSQGAADGMASLRELLSERNLAAIEECGELAAGGNAAVTLGVAIVAIYTERDPAEIPVRRIPGPEPTSVLLYDPPPGTGRGGGLAPRRFMGERGEWQLWSRCGRRDS